MNKGYYIYQEKDPEFLLLQPVDENDLERLDNEIELIKKARHRFIHLAIKIEDWNNDLTPWCAPPAIGKEPFGAGARETLQRIASLVLKLRQELRLNDDLKIIIGGYSLAGLFALWAAYQKDYYGVNAASPSVWYPGWLEYATEKTIKVSHVYLSLGKKEEKTRNKIMATVGDNMRLYYDHLIQKKVDTTLEWNPGNHFVDADLRTAKGFVDLMNRDCK